MREDENATPRNEVQGTPLNCELMSKVDVSTVVTLIQTKQTEYFALWAVYTAVEFAAGSYGYGYSVPLVVGLAVLLGVWAFNLGHLCFVLGCVAQLNRLKIVLDAAVHENKQEFFSSLKVVLGKMQEDSLVSRLSDPGHPKRGYLMNSFVHLFIDSCASAALLARVDNPWIRDHIPSFLTATTGGV
jgi:hypothetical protein